MFSDHGVRRRIAAAGIALVAGLLALVIGVSSVPAADTAVPNPSMRKDLKRLKKELTAAEDAVGENSGAVDDHLDRASGIKGGFKGGFGFQKIWGGCSVYDVIQVMEDIDVSLSVAKSLEGKNQEALHRKAKKAASKLTDMIDEDCRTADAGAQAALEASADSILKKVREVWNGDGPASGATIGEVSGLKKKMIAGNRVFGCDVWEIVTQIELIDIQIDRAREIDFPKDKHGEKDQRRQIAAAIERTEGLINYWKEVPCDEPGTDGGGDGTGGDGGNGGGTDGGGGGTSPVTADFAYGPTDPVTFEGVDFFGLAGGGGGQYTYTWDYGDGGTASGANPPEHHFLAPGTYQVTVTISDGVSPPVSRTRDVTVKAPACSQAPTAHVMSNQDPVIDPAAVQVEIAGECPEFNRSGATHQNATAPAGKPFNSYNVRTEGDCGAPVLPVVTLECLVKPSGSVCWHLTAQPDITPGDTVTYRIKMNGQVVAEFPLTVGAAAPSSCTP